MTEEQRWQKEYRLKQDHIRVLSQIRDELCRIANAMAIVEDEGIDAEEPKPEDE